MDNRNFSPAISVNPSHCPHLGLSDDPATALAYPSAWNYCYRAKPPASVVSSHQVGTCLSQGYMRCPVYLSERAEALPHNLRGSSTVPARSQRRKKSKPLIWWILGVVVVLGTVYFGRSYIPLLKNLVAVPGIEATFTQIPPSTAASNGTKSAQTVPTISHSPTPRATDTVAPPATPTWTLAPGSPTQVAFTPIPGVCGYPLDVPFGKEIRFVLHRVLGGENLYMYAEQYQTTTEAIRAVNYFLPMPVWADWVVIIPVSISDTAGIPAFETYEAENLDVSLEQLAQQLNADPLALAKYNNFNDSCKTFSGWVIVPRTGNTP